MGAAAQADEVVRAVGVEVRRLTRLARPAVEALAPPRNLILLVVRRPRASAAAASSPQAPVIRQLAGAVGPPQADHLREANAQVHPGPPAHGSMATRSLG